MIILKILVTATGLLAVAMIGYGIYESGSIMLSVIVGVLLLLVVLVVSLVVAVGSIEGIDLGGRSKGEK